MGLLAALRSLNRALDELAALREAAYGELPGRVPPPPGVPDLHTQLEELFDEVWRQEAFERSHPLTCGAMRETISR